MQKVQRPPVGKTMSEYAKDTVGASNKAVTKRPQKCKARHAAGECL